MKSNGQIEQVIYVHKHKEQHYVLSYGITFQDFVHHLPIRLQNILLLKHQCDETSFNIHTMMEYIEKDQIDDLLKDDVNGYGDFCWIDFAEEVGVNELKGQEIAELLFLGHLKQHLKLPFYSNLNNRFVYLAHDDGWFNKVYYRDFNHFYTILGGSIADKLSEVRKEKTFLGIKKKTSSIPPIPLELLRSLDDKINEGLVLSLEKTSMTRGKIEIPVWVIGDYYNMDEMYEDYQDLNKDVVSCTLVYDRRAKEWSTILK